MDASFDFVSWEWLARFVEHRIGDKRITRLIYKWLRAGILEDGTVTVSDRGTGQGSVASPLLANIYLHYVFDLWVERWRRREATGDMIVVRYVAAFALLPSFKPQLNSLGVSIRGGERHASQNGMNELAVLLPHQPAYC